MKNKQYIIIFALLACLLFSCGGTNTGNAGANLEGGSNGINVSTTSNLTSSPSFHTAWCFDSLSLVIETEGVSQTYGPFPYIQGVKQINESGATDLGSFPKPKRGDRLVGVKIQLTGDCGGSSPSIYVENQFGNFEIYNAINLEYREDIDLSSSNPGEKVEVKVDITGIINRLRQVKSNEEIQGAMYGPQGDTPQQIETII